jgi:gamma-glutamyltranspeptidase
MYKGYRIHVMPPNSQGLALLMQANILENFDLAKIGHNTLDYVHLFSLKRRSSPLLIVTDMSVIQIFAQSPLRK